jgi:hypothetical protein
VLLQAAYSGTWLEINVIYILIYVQQGATLYSLSGKLATIKGQRISWLDHLEGTEEDRMPKKIFTQELEGPRRRGRPRKGWREEVERDLQVLGMRR